MECGVCIGGGDWDESPEFSVWEYPKARKEHKCCECGRPIGRGQQYERYTDKFDGIVASTKSCMDCSHIRKGLTCEGGALPQFGNLWSEVIENFPYLKSTACLTKIKTPSAKAYFLERWREWKFKDHRSNNLGKETP